MRHVVLAGTALLALAACTPRPERAKGPTLAWDTANSAVRNAPATRTVRPTGAPSAAGTWIGAVRGATGERQVVLSLVPGGAARVVLSPSVPGGPDSLIGGWGREATWVSLEILKRDTTAVMMTIEFDLLGEELLHVTGWDPATLGSEAPRFRRQ